MLIFTPKVNAKILNAGYEVKHVISNNVLDIYVSTQFFFILLLFISMNPILANIKGHDFMLDLLGTLSIRKQYSVNIFFKNVIFAI